MRKLLGLTFISRGAAAFGGIFLYVVIGRIYSPEMVAAFALSHSVMLGAVIVCKCGMNDALIRYVGQGCGLRSKLLLLFQSIRRAVILSFLVLVFLLMIGGYVESYYEYENLKDVYYWLVASIPFVTLNAILAGFLKGEGRPVTACFIESGGVSLFGSLLIFLWGGASPGNAGESLPGLAFFISSLFSFLCVGGCIFRRLLKESDRAEAISGKLCGTSDFFNVSFSFFILSVSQLIHHVCGALVLASLLSELDFSIFKIAERLSLIVSFSLIVLNSILPPRFARLYAEKKLSELERLARKGILIGWFFSMPTFLVFLLFPSELMLFFGDGYGSGGAVLIIMAAGQLINVATGSVGFLLGMTGNDVLMRNISLLCSVSGLTVMIFFTIMFGVVGAAFGFSFILVLQNVVAFAFVQKRLGINLISWKV